MIAATFRLRDAWLLAAAVPLVLLWLAWWRSRRPPALPYSSLGSLRALGRPRGALPRWLGAGLRCATLGLLLLALARPQSGRRLTELSTRGIDIVIALDASHSMRALDLDPGRPLAERRNRLEVARDVVAAFVERRAADRVGLVVFGESAFTQCPLTLDHDVLRQLLAAVQIGVAGEFTAVGDGLATAVRRLQRSTAKSKVVILLTDGRSNRGSIAPLEAAEVARALGVKVYTIGAGTRGSAPFLVRGGSSPRVIRRHVDLDRETLAEIARITGAASFLADDADALAQIYRQIDELERSEIRERRVFDADDRFPWFIGGGLLLLLAEIALGRTHLRSLP